MLYQTVGIQCFSHSGKDCYSGATDTDMQIHRLGSVRFQQRFMMHSKSQYRLHILELGISRKQMANHLQTRQTARDLK